MARKKKTITLPRSYDPPGRNTPPETLAYLSEAEHDFIRRMTDGRHSKGPKGVRSYVLGGATTKGTAANSTMNSAKSSGSATSTSNSKAGSGGSSTSNSKPGGSAPSSKPSGGAKSPAAGGSGAIGSKGGGASTQAPGAGKNAGTVSSTSLGNAKAVQQQARSTALGQAAQQAKATASKAQGSGTSTQFGGRSMSSPMTAPNGSYYGPKGGTALNTDARLAAARSVGFSQPAIRRTPGDAEMLGRMMMAESQSIRNPYGLPRTSGLQGVAEVVRNRVLSDQFPNTVPGVLTQRKQFSPMADGSFGRTPANPMATRVADAVLSGEQPPIVGNALNYANIHTVNNLPGYSSAATRRAFNSMQPTAVIADSRNPVSRSHTFGTIGKSDVSFGGPPAYSPGMSVQPVQMASAASAAQDPARAQRAAQALQTLTSPLRASGPMGPMQGPFMPGDPTRMQGIPAPASMNPMAVQTPNMRPLQSFVTGDPRSSMPPGAFPRAPMQSPVMGDPRAAMAPGSYPAAPVRFAPPSDPRVGLPPGAFPAARMQSPVMGDPRVSMPPGRLPARPASPFVATDPRVAATPLGRLPAASPRPPSLVATDPRAAMPPGSYPQAMAKEYYDRIAMDMTSPQIGGPGLPFRADANPGLPPGYAERYAAPPAAPAPAQSWSVPPMGGALPPEIGTALGVWSTNRVPAARPHLGTPASQTATVDDAAPSWWQQGKNLVKTATDAAVETYKEAAPVLEENAGKIALADKLLGPGWALKFLGGGSSGGAQQALRGYGNTQNDMRERTLQQAMASGGMMPGGYSSGSSSPSAGASSLSQDQLAQLLTSMQAKGATPEEIAFVQSFIENQTA